MCVAFLKRENDSLVFALNRDEFKARPTKPMFFNSDKGYFSGVDLEKGGTWFLIKDTGDFSFVTNIRNKNLIKDHAKSRGELPFKILNNEKFDLADYNPFNAVWGSREKIYYVNNIDNRVTELNDEIIGVSNSTLPTDWPKVLEGKKFFQKLNILNSKPEELAEEIFSYMQSTHAYDFIAPDTSFSEEQERFLTPLFIQGSEYGTVSTTVFIINGDRLRLFEKNYVSDDFFEADLKISSISVP